MRSGRTLRKQESTLTLRAVFLPRRDASKIDHTHTGGFEIQ